MALTETLSPGVVILGVGLTGRGTALGLALERHRRGVLLVEKASRPGGPAGGFRWKTHRIDHGPHRLSPDIAPVRESKLCDFAGAAPGRGTGRSVTAQTVHRRRYGAESGARAALVRGRGVILPSSMLPIRSKADHRP